MLDAVVHEDQGGALASTRPGAHRGLRQIRGGSDPHRPVTVSYELTELGLSLHHLMSGLRGWAETHMDEVLGNRATHDARTA
ncbi:hypothetical protein GCM10014719_59370 [Planomonospora parontospora subsp. antibiotica]|nr:hypothetical protein GCM10014719_59370 [Planomonospora parontospora subsp. antibiotica]GII18955.1 hypothetical protein Ppa05_56810 [Planomonospora parontospora subsp. antibiotica]